MIKNKKIGSRHCVCSFETNLPVPFIPDGRIRASYFPWPKIWSRTFFSFSRKFIFALFALHKNHIKYRRKMEENKFIKENKKSFEIWYRNTIKSCIFRQTISSKREHNEHKNNMYYVLTCTLYIVHYTRIQLFSLVYFWNVRVNFFQDRYIFSEFHWILRILKLFA